MQQDIAAVRAVIDGLVAAWAAHDAEAYGALFTEDASYISFVGTVYRGRRDIVSSHRALFAKFLAGTKLADEVLDIRFCGTDTAVVTSRGDTYKGGRPRKLSKVQTYTMVRDTDGQWRVAAFQNTQRKPVMEKISFLVSPDTVPRTQQ
ncbi:SgcJ/EcaC family oxidoreductase [Nocardia cyriacigeorgica]|uniref:SgcJ/EcaC family oxidoreductase n=1 Tax=Nocardia cyriacigeorgica TaxID=135487 RepID=UPI00189464BA|nr:SgcJ/EcaC family oxidoreductase [Nocardia cyriacigeorgica]MBF6454752.1 SgcJ/EcaC family oxidoreductase [Nocardia cyriacigeorgica]MBF6477176.1 SgcJ/EcaC family oxidoreductase [Nocardia cyriacigeorgica]MBF6552646.1 SgcJ/EcaC family oxidoreductase [Nocardia cyriacigeorgica]